MISGQLAANTPNVVAEIIDGELVVMNLTTGTYHSSQGLGAAIWGWLAAGHEIRTVRDALAAHFAVPSAQVEADLAVFVEQLLDGGLMSAKTGAGMPAGGIEVEPGVRYAAPRLASYTDMQDLLLLDPIHDVDETGWPTLPPSE